MRRVSGIKIAVALAIAALFALFAVACSSGSESATDTTEETTATETQAETTDEASTEEAASAEVPTPENPVIRISTTTSVNDSGLLPYLQPYFEEDTGYQMEVTSAGTGAAIEKGRTGDADALLVHAKASEEEFIEEGYGVERVPFMYNYFVIVGPEDDPAGIKDAASAAALFSAILAV